MSVLQARRLASVLLLGLIACGGQEPEMSDSAADSYRPRFVESTGEHEFTNRLVDETSPYLRQHAHNPVDWYPWGQEAFPGHSIPDTDA